MDQFPQEGVIVEQIQSPEYVVRSIPESLPDVSRSTARVIVGVVLLFIISGLAVTAYQFYQSWRTIQFELADVQQQLDQAKENYTTTFQEKNSLQSAFSRVNAQVELMKTTGTVKNFATLPPHSVPVKFILGKSQKVAQSFKPLSSQTVSLIGIQVYEASASGNSLFLNFFEYTGGAIDGGRKLATASAEIKKMSVNNPVTFSLSQAISIDPKKEYMFTIEAEDDSTEADLLYTETDTDGSGTMYEYTTLLDGNGQVIKPEFSWIGRDGQDLKYNALVQN